MSIQARVILNYTAALSLMASYRARLRGLSPYSLHPSIVAERREIKAAFKGVLSQAQTLRVCALDYMV